MIKILKYGHVQETTPLVAIPGIDGSIGSIQPMVEGLSESRQVWVVDYSGEKNATLEDLANEIYGKIQAQITGPFYLSGQSIGTILAAKLAARDLPVRKVVLTCTFTRLSDLPLKISTFFMKMSPDWLYRITSKPSMKYVCGPVGDGDHHPFFEASRNSDKSDIRRRTRWQIGKDFSSDLLKISLPLLVLMGADDRFVPDAAEEIEKLRDLFTGREDCTVQVIPNAGHVFLPSDAIENANRSIDNFLR